MPTRVLSPFLLTQVRCFLSTRWPSPSARPLERLPHGVCSSWSASLPEREPTETLPTNCPPHRYGWICLRPIPCKLGSCGRRGDPFRANDCRNAASSASQLLSVAPGPTPPPTRALGAENGRCFHVHGARCVGSTQNRPQGRRRAPSSDARLPLPPALPLRWASRPRTAPASRFPLRCCWGEDRAHFYRFLSGQKAWIPVQGLPVSELFNSIRAGRNKTVKLGARPALSGPWQGAGLRRSRWPQHHSPHPSVLRSGDKGQRLRKFPVRCSVHNVSCERETRV
ncbi:hypothetical protein HJG60_011107 [Phyllostomus discolor]|uniref:Uncharacterized protein n=1 Tax=Phyllostomus discolor TaxID=89673 RepID=A0A833ZWY7_9CHIR|nr:hypothetical protein HJG60_011107 [Phyllostomus discolor]